MPTKNGEQLLYPDLSYKIRGACFEIWKEFGNAFKESVVRNALVKKLQDLGLKVEVDKRINIYFEGKKVGVYIPDLIVNGLILIELKRKPFLVKQDDQQFWYYLKCTNYKLGFLINFGDRELEIKRRIFDKARVTIPRSSASSSASIRLDKKGFTVLELVMVSAIMVVLIVLFLANFHGFENKAVLENEADKLISILKQAQIMSLTGQTIGSMRYNYGVHLEECDSGSCTYILFGDLKQGGNKFYDSGEENNGGKSFEIIKGTYISSLTPKISNELDIIFEAPLGNIYFNNSQVDETAQIIISHNIFNGTKIISINRISGQINIQ